MTRQILVVAIFALGASILNKFIPPAWDWAFGAIWGITMWEAIAFTGRVEAKRHQPPRSIDPSF